MKPCWWEKARNGFAILPESVQSLNSYMALRIYMTQYTGRRLVPGLRPEGWPSLGIAVSKLRNFYVSDCFFIGQTRRDTRTLGNSMF